MKRAVLIYSNVEKCIQNRVFATSYSLQELSFKAEEEVYIALRIVDAKELRIGKEYNYIFIFGSYLGKDEKEAERLYGKPKWKHFWSIKEINRIKPFSLKEDLTNGTGRDKKEFYDYYRGQELAHKIVIDVLPEDEKLFKSCTKILDNDVASTLEEDIFNKKVESIEEDLKIKQMNRTDNLKQIKKISAENLKTTKRKIGSFIYGRNPELSARLKLFYRNKCQVCGGTFLIPETDKYYSESHHIIPLAERGNDIDKNIIIVCPTCHKKFDRKYYLLDVGKKEFKRFSKKKKKHIETILKSDKHLFIN